MHRIACVKPVDELSKKCVRNVSPARLIHMAQITNADTSPIFPQLPQPLTTTLSTVFLKNSDLLESDLSTVYTGLITNTTK